HNRQRDIGFEQGDADFAQCGRDVVLAQRTAPAQAVEDLVEPVAQTIEHRAATPERKQAGARNSRTGRLPERWASGGALTRCRKAGGRYRPPRFLSIMALSISGGRIAA